MVVNCSWTLMGTEVIRGGQVPCRGQRRGPLAPWFQTRGSGDSPEGSLTTWRTPHMEVGLGAQRRRSTFCPSNCQWMFIEPLTCTGGN